VDAVLLTGDVIDRKNMYFEAFGDFEAGLKELTNSNIPVYLVAGNHDFDVVPELLKNLSGYDISQLGHGGEWSQAIVSKAGRPVIQLVGWSYPTRHVDYSPLEQFDLEPRGELTTIGVLHSSVDKSDSRFAPVPSTDLNKPGLDGWVLGHLHNPRLQRESGRFQLMTGTSQPLDPTETGGHGPWILRFSNKGVEEIEHCNLASLRYEKIEIDAGQVDRLEQVPARFYSRANDLLNGLSHENLSLLVLTLELTGRTAIFEELKTNQGKLIESLRRKTGNVNLALASLVNRTLPEVDLEDIVGSQSPPGALADLIVKLDQGSTEEIPDDLLQTVRDKLNEAYYANAYEPLRSEGSIDPPGRETVLEVLEEQSWDILESFLAQQGK